MMDKKDELLISQFLAAHRTEVPDKGFSRRVMRRLPDRTPLWARLWTFTGYSLALVLFIALDGFPLLLDALRETFRQMLIQGATSSLDLRSLGIAAVVLIFLGYRQLYQEIAKN